MADRTARTAATAATQTAQTAAPVADTAPVAPVAAPVEPKRTISVRFTPPTYAGKPNAKGVIERPRLAEATLLGCFGDAPLVLAGFTLAKSDREIVVYMPKAGTFTNSPVAVQPLRIPAPEGVETEDGMVLAAGARLASERFMDAIRDAWAAANKTAQTAWGVDFPLSL